MEDWDMVDILLNFMMIEKVRLFSGVNVPNSWIEEEWEKDRPGG